MDRLTVVSVLAVQAGVLFRSRPQALSLMQSLSLFELRRQRQELFLQHLTEELQKPKTCSCCIPKTIEQITQK